MMTDPETAIASRTMLLIQAIDVWHFHPEDQHLHHVSLVEVQDDETVRIPADRHPVSATEGLLGKVCDSKQAALLDPEECSGEGLNEGLQQQPEVWLAIPCFNGVDLTGIVLLGLSGRHTAVEVWNRDDRDELAMTAGHYRGLPSFEFITQYTRFPKGAGLPGKVWSSRAAHLADNLSQNSSFIRSFGQDPAQVSSGIGLPVGTVHGFPASALLMLEVEESPFSRSTFLLNCEVTIEGTERTLRLLSKNVLGEATLQGLLDDERMIQITEQVHNASAPILISIQCEISTTSHICLAIPFFCDGDVNQILCFTV